MKSILPLPSGHLRPASADDTDRILDLLRDKDVRRFLCDDTLLPRADVERMLEESLSLDTEGLGLWVIEQEPDGFAGLVGLTPVSAEASVSHEMTGGIEPTIAILPSAGGRGLATDAMAAIIDHARWTLRLSRLVAAVDLPNTRSHRLMLRSGFRKMGSAPGPAHELVLYELVLASVA